MSLTFLVSVLMTGLFNAIAAEILHQIILPAVQLKNTVTNNTQTIIRSVVPGALMFVLVRSAIAPETPPWELNIPLDGKSLLYVWLFVIGYLYHATNLRKRMCLRQHWERTDDFIWTRLVSFLDNDTREKARQLPKNAVMQVFWNLVDNDKTLSHRSEEIRWNGTFISSAADVALFSMLSAICHLACFFLTSAKLPHLVWMGASAAVSISVEYCLLPWLIKRHFQLQDRQLEYVSVQKRDDLSIQLKKAL